MPSPHHPDQPTTHRGLTTAALILIIFMAAAEATIVATALPSIVADLGGVQRYGWVVAAYLLACTITIPVYGRLSDVLGRRPVIWLGIALFLLGSLLCGLSRTMTMLIVSRAIQGMGAGGIQPVSMTIVGDLYTLAERGRVQGWMGAVWGIAGIAGPLLGAWLVTALSWSWVFWINLPFGAAGVALLAYAYRERPHGVRASIDWAGAGTFAAASLALLLALEGVVPVALLTVGIALSVLFVLVERRAESPILPLGLLVRRDVAIASLVSLGLGALLMGVVNYLPLFVQGVRGGTPVQSGAVVAPMLIGWPIAATLSSQFIIRFGSRRAVVIGTTLCVVGCIALALAAALGGTVMLGGAMALIGLGLGAATSTLVIALQSSVGWRERGVITATNVFSRLFGGTVGVSVLGVILARRLEARLDPARVSAALDRERVSAVVDPEVATALGAAFDPIFLVVVAIAVATALLSWQYREQLVDDAGRPVAA